MHPLVFAARLWHVLLAIECLFAAGAAALKLLCSP